MANPIEKLTDAGEEALAKLSHAPGMSRVSGTAGQLTQMMQDMQRRLRGVDALEKHLAELEARVDTLEGKPPAASEPVPVAETDPPST
jgi:hypothetical protein